jgi:Kef-type K+ transport system membrane component KefB
VQSYQETLAVIAGFGLVALASKQIGLFFVQLKLPLVSGFLFTGIIAGPSILGLLPVEAADGLRFVDEVSLAFIAFAAGSELHLKKLRSRFKSITWTIIGLVISTFTLGSMTTFLLADSIPFMKEMPFTNRIAISILAGVILVARSPSSAIAVVKELRAKGPFTQTALGVTVIMDVVVIIFFAFNSSVADALLTNLPFSFGFILLVLIELLLSLGIGYVLGKSLQFIVSRRIGRNLKTIIILMAGYGVFLLSDIIRDVTRSRWSFEVLLEPLLICMVGGFLLSNYSQYRHEFLTILHRTGPPIYTAFFTLTGASLMLDVLAETWMIALILFGVRLSGIFLGSFGGGILAGDSMKHTRIGWMAYITQAGIGLGLAKEVAVAFPEWGAAFSSMMISVIVLNQIVGPPFFKWAMYLAGEALPRDDTRQLATKIPPAL